MYTLRLLAPILVSMCTEGVTTGQGDYCVVHEPAPVIKFYEPGKSCYVDGIFYRDCADKL